MGTVAVSEGGTGRRSVDREINLVPMVDLLVCCISFLLITAVWSHSTRLEARGDVPGTGQSPPQEPEKALHVDLRGDQTFHLSWKAGPVVLASTDIPRQALRTDSPEPSLRFPELARKVEEEWQSSGLHRNPNDHGLDRVVLHTGSTTSFEEIVAVMDALQAPKRAVDGEPFPVPVFRLAFAAD